MDLLRSYQALTAHIDLNILIFQASIFWFLATTFLQPNFLVGYVDQQNHT